MLREQDRCYRDTKKNKTRNIQYRISNIEYPISNIQYRILKLFSHFNIHYSVFDSARAEFKKAID